MKNADSGTTDEPRPRVVIAGATGFVGAALTRSLQDRFEVVGLTRSAREGGGVSWRSCDLYSLLDVERGLEGADYAIYLVHSMLPSARLTQASFEDLDLVLADNFARAAATAGVRQIVYLGGLFPHEEVLSTHLESRLEVERTLGAYGVPVTALRAGLVVGAGGSSLHILTTLVRRLPAMITPAWTLSPTQPIALPDVVRAVRHVLGRPDEMSGAFDIGGPDVMSYRDMMKRTASAMGLTRPMASVPFFTPGLSTLWVCLITGAPMALVGPLVQSLEHEMVVSDNPLQAWLVQDALSFEDALALALSSPPQPRPRIAKRGGERRRAKVESTVRSVQRLPRPPGASARWVAEEYVRWLPTAPIPGLRCETEGPVARFYLWPLAQPLLVLRLDDARSPLGRALFYIEGGVLARLGAERRGRFEFRLTPDGRSVMAAVHDFRPTLPWYVYEYSQAIAHLLVMRLFGRHLARVSRASVEATPPQSAADATPTAPAPLDRSA